MSPAHTHKHNRPGDIYRTASFEARFPKLARGEHDEPTDERKQQAIEHMAVAGESQYVSLRQQYGLDPGIPDHLEKATDGRRKTWKDNEEKDANPKAGEGPLYNTMNPYAPDATVIEDSEKNPEQKNQEENNFGVKATNSTGLTTTVD